MRFKRSAAGNSDTNPGDLWFAICIDVLGPVVSQIDACTILPTRSKSFHGYSTKVSNAFAAFCAFYEYVAGEERWKRRFSLKGSSYPSCELDNWSYTPNQIVEIIGGRKIPRDVLHSWRKDFIENIEDYIDEAKALVNGNYRWLIHAQKPLIAWYVKGIGIAEVFRRTDHQSFRFR